MTKKETAFARWYAKNREEFNAKRRDRYRNDDEFRSKALKNNDKYYKGQKYRRRQWIERHQVEINGVYVLAYSISEVAAMLDRPVEHIRYWHRRGYIGDAKRGNHQRRYTQENIILLKQLDTLMRKYRPCKHYRYTISCIKKKWK